MSLLVCREHAHTHNALVGYEICNAKRFTQPESPSCINALTHCVALGRAVCQRKQPETLLTRLPNFHPSSTSSTFFHFRHTSQPSYFTYVPVVRHSDSLPRFPLPQHTRSSLLHVVNRALSFWEAPSEVQRSYRRTQIPDSRPPCP